MPRTHRRRCNHRPSSLPSSLISILIFSFVLFTKFYPGATGGGGGGRNVASLNAGTGGGSGPGWGGRTVTRKPVARHGKGSVGRVRDIQARINELERSATEMYEKHAGAAMALEREVAALREERQRLAALSGDGVIVLQKPQQQQQQQQQRQPSQEQQQHLAQQQQHSYPRPSSSHGLSSASPASHHNSNRYASRRPGSAPTAAHEGKARQTWMIPATRKMQQGESTHRLSKQQQQQQQQQQHSPTQRPHTAGPGSPVRKGSKQQQQQQGWRYQSQPRPHSSYSAKAQRAASARLSRGSKAHPDPWELPPDGGGGTGGGADAGGGNEEGGEEAAARGETRGGGGGGGGFGAVVRKGAPPPRPKTAGALPAPRGGGSKKQFDAFRAQGGSGAPVDPAEQKKRMGALSSPQRKAVGGFLDGDDGNPFGDGGRAAYRPSSAAQVKRMKELSSPGHVRERVVTEGISKSTADWVVFYAKQTPGPGQCTFFCSSPFFRSFLSQLSMTRIYLRASSRSFSSILSLLSFYCIDYIPGIGDTSDGQTFSTANPLSHIDVLERRAATTPGPGQYHIPGVADSTSGQGFSTANPKTEVDFMVYESRSKPGPGQYKISVDNKGRKMMGMNTGGFCRATRFSHIDCAVYEGKSKPGPGQYHIPGVADSTSGQGFSTANPKSHIDWAVYEGKSKPGPGQYAVDKAFKAMNDSRGGGSFSTAFPKSQVDFLCHEAAQKPGPGQYGAPKRPYIEKGGSGKFPFVYRPKDPSKAHLAKG